MNSIPQVQQNIVRVYTAQIKKIFPEPTYESQKLLLVLEIYRWHLRRADRKIATGLDELATLKHGVRQAEILFVDIVSNDPTDMMGWHMGAESRNLAWHLASLLTNIMLELTQAIIGVEEQFPKLKPAFDRERAQYRKMKYEAEEALRLD